MLHVAFEKLPSGRAQQVRACNSRLGVDECHAVLQLISKTRTHRPIGRAADRAHIPARQRLDTNGDQRLNNASNSGSGVRTAIADRRSSHAPTASWIAALSRAWRTVPRDQRAPRRHRSTRRQSRTTTSFISPASSSMTHWRAAHRVVAGAGRPGESLLAQPKRGREITVPPDKMIASCGVARH